MAISKTRLYSIWKHMGYRCYSKTDENYKDYGGRGITVCKEWRANLLVFIDWAETNGYRPELQIDRENNDGNYCPENCRWVTPLVNVCNRRMLDSNTSGYTGVSLHKRSSMFHATVSINNKIKYITSNKSAHMAALLRDDYIVENNLPNKLNFPKEIQYAKIEIIE